MPTASINGINLFYETTGGGEALLFLHGLGSSTVDWGPQVAFFRDSYQCITADMRGHGRSDKPPGPYSVRGFAADTAALIRHLGLGAVHAVGVSMGGMIAFQMAVDFPDCLKSMVIINSGPEVPNRTLKDKLAIWQRLILFRLLDMRKIGEVIGGRLFPLEEQGELRQGFVDRWAENHKPSYMAATRALAGWSVMEHVRAIQTPTLVLAADQDYTPVEMKEAYVRQMQDARLEVIRDARHAVNFAQPEKVNPLIEAFLKEGQR